MPFPRRVARNLARPTIANELYLASMADQRSDHAVKERNWPVANILYPNNDGRLILPVRLVRRRIIRQLAEPLP